MAKAFENKPAATATDINSVNRTFTVLYDLWFPLNQLPIPPHVLADIEAISQQVQAGFWKQVSGSENPLLDLLTLLTYPTRLPFYSILKDSTDPAIARLISVPGGMGGLTRDQTSQVLAFFFEGSATPLSTQIAMVLREAFLSVIWDLPIAVPLTGIQIPTTFVSNPQLYAKINYPKIPPSWLTYDAGTKTIKAKNGVIDYVVIGSGPAGATMAHELQRAGKKVVLVEQGPWVVWGSMDTMSYSKLMFANDTATTANNSVVVRSGQAMGGGTTVNIDLAFSPLEATIQSRIANWIVK